MESIEAELEASVQAIRFSHEVGIHHKILEVDSAQVIAKLQEHGDDGFGGEMLCRKVNFYLQQFQQWGVSLTRQETNNTTHILAGYAHDIEDYVT